MNPAPPVTRIRTGRNATGGRGRPPDGRRCRTLPLACRSVQRCAWANSAPEYVEYHDQEWGTPLTGDDAVFERLCLEAFQSGLSWITILRKRPAFRAAFAGFAIDAVAAFTDEDEARLMADAGIVRNRAKISAAVRNARAAQQQPEGLSDLLWSFAPAGPRGRPATLADVPATSADSVAMAK